MRRLALIISLGCFGCVDFDTAQKQYEDHFRAQLQLEGDPCREHSDCSGTLRCTDGTCRSGEAKPNQTCSRPNDCQSGLFCEAAADAYLCLEPTTCLGRLCANDVGCRSGCTGLTCVSGVCEVTTCTEGAACTSASECCAGFGCSADGGCTYVDAGVYPGGFRCSSAAQCESGECGGNGLCRADAGSCNHIGVGCGGNCCAGLNCGGTGVCCLTNGRACLSDGDCCTGQCLAGTCADATAKRQVGLPCAQDNDCHSNRCNPDTKRCSPADAGS